jgi:Polyketide cyclase / dehydrase and lipid transport
MTILKRVIIGLVTLIVLVVVIGFLLPRQVHVERSIVINAPQAQLFDALNGFKRFNEFSPWAALDPNTQYSYEGPESGVGARMSWVSSDPELGSGTNEVVESKAPDLIRTRLNFGGQLAEASFKFEPADTGTRVTWGFDGDLGNNPIMRFVGLMFDKWIGSDYEKGLARMKEVMEQSNAG